MTQKMVVGHTPGPWTVAPVFNRSAVDYGFRRIEPSNLGIHIEGVNAEANARLIASAPELLEALKALSQTLSAETQAMARAVIAKAEGRPAV